MRLHSRLSWLALGLSAWTSFGCHSVEHAIGDAPHVEDRMAWWRQARFGMFVHWGPYAIPAGEWNGRTDYGEWIRANARIPLEQYDALAAQWDPKRFDADSWARLAADAGMKYMVVTTKHHDGFALFDSSVSDWDMASTPARRDIMSEVAEACRAHGVVPCWYYSIMDWHHPDYLPRRPWETDRPVAGAEFDRYENYLAEQVTELLSRYGPIGVMWFDGDWESTWTQDRGLRLYDLCRRLQPNVIVNNRIGAGRSKFSAFLEGAEGAGDFGTPEQEIPSVRTNGADWEACITMNDNWGYNAHDREFKSSGELLRLLVEVVSRGGNLLLNVGPDADGAIPAECVERLQAVGRWMRVNGEAISGTSATPVDPPAWGRLTMKDDGANTRLFLHVFEMPAQGQLVLDSIGNPVLSARLLGDPKRRLEVEATRGRIVVGLEGAPVDPEVNVVELVLAGDLIPYVAPLIETESDVFLDEAVVTIAAPSSALEARYTLDGSEPTTTSALANGPIAVRETTTVRARTFHAGAPVGAVATRAFVRGTALPARALEVRASGLRLRTGPSLGAAFPGDLDPAGEACVVERPAVPSEMRNRENTLFVFEGFVHVPADDVYVTQVDSDDGARVTIDGRLVCEYDGRAPRTSGEGSIALAAGWHALEVRHRNDAGATSLTVRLGRIGKPLAPIAPTNLAHAP